MSTINHPSSLRGKNIGNTRRRSVLSAFIHILAEKVHSNHDRNCRRDDNCHSREHYSSSFLLLVLLRLKHSRNIPSSIHPETSASFFGVFAAISCASTGAFGSFIIRFSFSFFRQKRIQHLPRLVKTRLYRPLGNGQHNCNLLDRALGKIPQHHHLAQRRQKVGLHTRKLTVLPRFPHFL